MQDLTRLYGGTGSRQCVETVAVEDVADGCLMMWAGRIPDELVRGAHLAVSLSRFSVPNGGRQALTASSQSAGMMGEQVVTSSELLAGCLASWQ